MDDMVFHNNNKNAIYVLNSNYNSYGELGRLNIFRSSAITDNDTLPTSNDCQPFRKLSQNYNPAKYSSENISSSCSPATSAIQKLFNCSSSINNSGGSGHNNSYINNNNTINNNNNNNINNNNNNNNTNNNNNNNANNRRNNSISHLNELGQPKLTTLGSSKSYHNHLNVTTGNHIGVGSNGITNCGNNSSNTSSSSSSSSNIGNCSSISTMKKGPPIKSTLIAKKTKFLKYLEEEKWRKLSIEHLSTTNCERNSEINSSPNTSSMISIQPTINKTEQKLNSHSFEEFSHRQTSDVTNWSRNADNTNSGANKNSQKSSSELYKEAAQLLGLSCTLCDNCRCLDCQSRYFECDDSDSFSEMSFMDDYYDDTILHDSNDYQSIEYNSDATTNGIKLENHQLFNEGAIGHDNQNRMPSGCVEINDNNVTNDDNFNDDNGYVNNCDNLRKEQNQCMLEQHCNCQSLQYNEHHIDNGYDDISSNINSGNSEVTAITTEK